MKRTISLLLALLLLASAFAGCGKSGDAAGTPGAGSPSPGHFEGAGFATGEEVLLTALSAIHESNYTALVSCYAVETFFERYRFDDFYFREGYNTNATTQQYQTEDDPFGMALTRYAHFDAVLADAAQPFELAVNGGFAAQLQGEGNARSYFGMLYGGSILDREFQFEEYLQRLNDGQAQRVFSTLRTTGAAFSVTDSVLDRLQQKGDQQRGERFLSQLENSAAQIGADEYAEYAVPVNVDGFDCYFAVRAARYGGSWYLWRLGSNYADVQTMMGGFTAEFPGLDEAAPSTPASLPQLSAGSLPALHISGAGFAGAEAAADAYTEALRNLDADAAIACYPVDRFAAQDLQLANISMWRLYQSPVGGGTLLETAARAALADSWLYCLLRNYRTVYARDLGVRWDESLDGYDPSGKDLHTDHPERYPNALPQLHEMINDDATREALRGMQVLSSETKRNELTQQRAEALGASDYCGVLRQVQVGNTSMLLCVEAACFDGSWYVMSAWYYNGYLEGGQQPELYS